MASGQDGGRASLPRPAELGRWRFALERLRRGLTLAGTPASDGDPSSDLEHRFIARCAELSSPSVLELGSLRSVPGRSTLHRDWVPHAAEFLGTDIEDGPDVDIVADLGFEVIATDYDFPVRLYARRMHATQHMPAFLNTTLWGEKRAPTPDEYRYEL